MDPSTAFAQAREALAAGRADRAVALLSPCVGQGVDESALWQLLGYAQRECQDMPEAVQSFTRAVACDAADPRNWFGLAQSRLDAGLPAVEAFRKGLALSPQNPGALRNCATALVAEGRPEAAESLLAEVLAREPEWIDGHKRLAALRWTAGDAKGFARSYGEGCAAKPQNLALRMAWFRQVAQSRDWDAALAILAEGRRIFGAQPALRVGELFIASESGDEARASQLFIETSDLQDEVRDLAFVRHGLRRGDLDAAEIVARRLLGTRSAVLAWPYLSLLWRLQRDPRADWLEGVPPHVRVMDLDIPPAELDELATVLRRLHTAAAPYLEQSVRGGTQTDGHVLLRHEPALQSMRRRLLAAVREHVDALPAQDPAHPLLGPPRRQLLLEGSWSVRLRKQGFNVAHTHPMGWISSAFYVSLPPAEELGAPPAGYLQLGAPPPELGLGPMPTQAVQPKPGRLVLFPSTMWHATVPFEDGERLVLAFDVRVPRY